jgi:RHS repeat-associated protein
MRAGGSQRSISRFIRSLGTRFRQHSQSQGRWLVPDPAGLAAVDITNPQTWNRYAYLANNPLNATDPLGLYIEPDCDDTVGGDCPGSPGLGDIFFPVCIDCSGGGGGGGHPPGTRPPSPQPAP